MATIAVFVRALHGGGAQRAMVRLAGGFAADGHSVELLTLDADGPFKGEVSPSVTVVPLVGKRIATAVPEICRYLRDHRPDAFVTTEPACNIAAVIAKLMARSKARLMIREGLFPSVAANEDPYAATRFAYRLAPLLYRFADVIVAIAADMADDLARTAFIDPKRIVTIAVNPVVTRELLAEATAPFEHPWFSPEIPVILSVGRLDAQKDHATLLSAFELVRAERRCRLMILGDGPLREQLERQRRASAFPDDIELPGFVGKPFRHMANCSVFVLSSRFEGLPNVLIEALACGAPVVATDCPSGPRDVLGLNGEFGKLVSVGNVPAMADAIRTVLNTRPNRARSVVRGLEYTVEISSRRYLEALFPDAVSR